MKRFACTLLLAGLSQTLLALTPIPTPKAMTLHPGVRPVAEPIIQHDATLPPEGYRLTITPEAITLAAADEAGLFYARQTLSQLAAPGGETLPLCEITDAPSLAIRGFMHDTGRNFQTIDELKAQLDLFARYKLNTFHWHLTDRPAWRIASRAYPQITSLAGRQPTRDPNDSYTYDQIRDLIAYAKARHIRIIPELDMPGHSDFFKPVFGFTMDSPQGIEVLKALITEFCREVPAEDCPILHIGSDEVRIADPAGFMNTIETHVRSLGRIPMIWSPGLPSTHDETLLQYWSEDPSRLQYVRGNHPVVDSSGGYLNLHDPQQIVLSQFTHPLPAGATGAILCCWPDANVDDTATIFRHNAVWPALLAFAEAAWHRPGTLSDLAAFEPTLEAHRDAFFAGKPFDYIAHMRHTWHMTAPEQRTLQGSAFLFSTRGAKVMLAPKTGTIAELTATLTLTRPTTFHLRLGFDSPGRSNRYAGGIPQNGSFDANGGELLINGIPLIGPTYQAPGTRRYAFDTWFHPDNEIAFGDEEFWWLREPTPITLPAGTHTFTLRVPIALPKQYWAVACLPVRKHNGRWVDDPTITFE